MSKGDALSSDQLYVTDRDQWREWLAEHHGKIAMIWLVFYKKETGTPSIPYDDAVEEALCYGWIDSILKKLDAERYVRKFTPRKPTSVWSELNKARVKTMIQAGRMTAVGQAAIDIAKKNGRWHQPDRPWISWDLPPEFQQALDQNQKAKTFFETLAPSYRKHYIGWIITAKRPETREKRIRESIQLLEKNQKLGMK
jgi:uncharacterized protein YdeI (YjbR/CyaY-like superfamily)